MQSATLLPPAETRHPMTHGLAELSLERRDGRTRLAHARTRPPLIVQRALYPDDAAPDLAHVFLSNPTGGLFAGDRQEIKVDVDHGAKAHVTTQSATKMYTMERGQAEQRVVLNVAAGGYLEYLPDPLIPFRNSSLEQDFCITVEPGGTLLWWDIITPGRVAMRESFQYRSVRNRLAVHRDGQRAVYREAFVLSPQESAPNGIGLLSAAFSGNEDNNGLTLGSMLIVCDHATARRILGLARETLLRVCNTRSGASMLPDGNGLGIKVIGADCSAAQQALNRVWSIARQELLGAEPPPSRKY
jgi:urease accessory protein